MLRPSSEIDSFMKKHIFGLGILVFLFCPRLHASESDPALGGLIERIAPGHKQDFIIETIPAPAGENVFEVETRNGKIVLRGDNTLSQSVAFNWYLKHEALPRWKLLIDATLLELKTGKPVDRAALTKQWRAHELKFARTAAGKYAKIPQGDFFSMSANLFKKYANE